MPSLIKQTLKWSARAVDRLRPPPPGVVVLIYHRVGRGSGLDVDLPLASFTAQIEHLARTGRVRSLDDALDVLEGGAPPTAGDPIVITFDDGTADFADTAYPVLSTFAIPATLYVATDFVDRGRDFPHDGTPLSWGSIRDLSTTGLVTVGSHTHTHALLDRLPPDDIDAELDRADALIAEHLGFRPDHFAYPKAVAGSTPADRAVRRRYRSGALAGTRPNRYGVTDPHRLCRSPIQNSDGMRFFHAKVAGGMRAEDQLPRGRQSLAVPGGHRMTRRLIHVTTTDMSLELLLGPQLTAFQAAGYEVAGMSAPGQYTAALGARGIEHIPLRHATRSMAPHHDVRGARRTPAHLPRPAP